VNEEYRIFECNRCKYFILDKHENVIGYCSASKAPVVESGLYGLTVAAPECPKFSKGKPKCQKRKLSK